MQHYTIADAGHFVPMDPLMAALDAGTMPTQGFRPYSNNVKPAFTGRKAAKAGLGVTGGFFEGASPTIDASWAMPAKRPLSRNARKRQAAARRKARKTATI